jgi:hypothetical protein
VGAAARHGPARALAELLVLFAIAWAVALAAAGDALGFSKEVGAFLAGVSLASTPYREAIASRLVTCATSCCCSSSSTSARGSTSRCSARRSGRRVFSAFVLVGNPLIVMAIMGAWATASARASWRA